MRVRLFDPEGIKPQEYKNIYPELNRIPEFEGLSGNQLMFVWYFANKTSPLMRIDNINKKVEEALDRSGWKLTPDNKEQILKLNFGETLEHAVEKMSSFDPGARYLGREVLRKIFEEYINIIDEGADAFVKITGSGKEKEETIDRPAFVTTSAKIASELPGLVERMEEGFGVTVTQVAEGDDDGVSLLRDWNLNRNKQ